MINPKPAKEDVRARGVQIACVVLALAIFVVDDLLPLGVAGGVPYVAVVLLSLWVPRTEFVLWAAAGCSVLTILGLVISPPGGVMWMVLTNRSLALLAIWASAGIGMRWKKAESETLSIQAQLLENQRLESLGILAGGVAHDFNNLLAGIMGNADFALSRLKPGEDHELELEEILAASRKAAELCSQLLAYTGGGVHRKIAINLSDAVREIAGQLDRPSTGSIDLVLGKHLPSIEADPEQIRQAITSVLTNALEAEETIKGSIRIATFEAELTPDQTENLLVNALSNRTHVVVLEIADTGVGMEAETRGRLFDPFFSTKFTGRGLGMAAVQGIVQGHQGGVGVETEPGRGTTVRMFFPILPIRVNRPADAGSVSREHSSMRRVLVIDDEESVRNLAAKMLTRAGFEIDVAEDGDSGLSKFQSELGRYDAVLLDLTMPGMSGDEVLVQIRAMDGRIPIIISSGYGEADVQQIFAGISNIEFVPKPYREGALIETFGKMLGTPTHSQSAGTDESRPLGT